MKPRGEHEIERGAGKKDRSAKMREKYENERGTSKEKVEFRRVKVTTVAKGFYGQQFLIPHR